MASGAMSSLPAWAKWSITAAGVLLSPMLAFLMALVVAVLVGPLKEAGLTASVAIVVACTIIYLWLRRRHVAPTGQRVDGA